MSILHVSPLPLTDSFKTLRLLGQSLIIGREGNALGNGDKRNNEGFIVSYCSLFSPLSRNTIDTILKRRRKKSCLEILYVIPFISSVSKSRMLFSTFSLILSARKEMKKGGNEETKTNCLVDLLVENRR